MQQKNFIIFLICSMVILIGWPLLERQIWPPRFRLSDAEAKQAARDVAPFGLFSVVPQLPGAAAAVQVADLIALSQADKKQIAELAALQAKPKPAPAPTNPDEHWVKTPFPILSAAVGINPALPLAAELVLLNPDRRKVVIEAARLLQRERMLAGVKYERVTIGEDGADGHKYHLRARLTTKGAGVELLILNRFQRADEEGRPVFTIDAAGNRVPTPMQLIQDDPYQASFLMFLFPPGEGKDGRPPRPFDTLGMQLWQLVKTGGKAIAVDKDTGIQKVVFQTTLPGYEDVVVRKTYSLAPGQYHLGLTLEFERSATGGREPVTLHYQLSGAHGTPVEGEWFTTIFRNAMIGIVDSGNNLSRDLQDSRTINHRGGGNRFPESDNKGGFFVQYAGVVLQYFTSQIVVSDKQAPKFEGGVEPKDLIAHARPTLESEQFKGHIIGIRHGKPSVLRVRDVEKGIPIEREFILLPRVQDRIEARDFKEGDAVVVSFYSWDRGQRYATAIHRGQVFKGFLDDITVRVRSGAVELRPGGKVVHEYLLYNGPVKVRLLEQFIGDKAIEPPGLGERYASTLHLLTLTDYPSNSIGQWTGLSSLVILFTRLMHWLLNLLHYLLPVYGLDIILLTLIVRGMMFPITRKSATSMAKLQALQPEMKKIQEKYKNDAQAKSQAMMELYRKHNVSPLGGCLPLLLQMPIFFGLYFCLQESIHFRLAPFLWIQNLAAPDMLWRWGENIRLISDPDNQVGFMFLGLIPTSMFYLGPYLNVLPIFAVALMVVQQKMMMPPPADEQQEMQQKMMTWMSFVIGILFYKVAAGLCIYFIVSSLWGMAERKLLPKRQAAGTPPPAGAAVTAKSPKGPPPRPGKGPKGRPGKKPTKPREPEGAMDKVKGWWSEVLKQAKKK
jgi:YidC/Oxa1 family membrane protein insertase